ncbi:hypothetical protein J4234_03135 [Candidatus Woesearchaeota archaeon]|nr:hypothetical protein [Candidatus Woesearchaeota archaeon]
MRNLYVFGNEYLEDDNFGHKVAQHLKKKFKIVTCYSPETLLDAGEKEIIILDVVKNAEKPIIIDDISKLKTNKIISLHDFDLGFFLNLMNNMGIKRKIKIIGIPAKGNIRETTRKVIGLIG